MKFDRECLVQYNGNNSPATEPNCMRDDRKFKTKIQYYMAVFFIVPNGDSSLNLNKLYRLYE